MNDLITIEASVTPAVITIDFDKIEKELDEQLKQYDVVVTENSVKGAKDVATKMNKVALAIDARRKELITEASAPIQEADARMRVLNQKAKDARERILKQVQVFEDKVRAAARDQLIECLHDLYLDYQVEEEFATVTIDDMVKLTAITATGALTAASLNELTARVRNVKDLQDKVSRRLLELENACYRAGLETPLTRAHVEHILKAGDEAYMGGLDSLISAELSRQKQAEEQREERKPKAKAKAASKPKKVGRKNWYVAATFAIETSDKMTAFQIEQNLREKLLAAGVKVKVDVSVEEV